MSRTFHENARDISHLAHAFHSPARLTELLQRFVQIEKGATLLALADQHAIRICLSDQLPPNFNGGYRNGGVELNKKNQGESQLATLAHELKHFSQECQGISPTHLRTGARIDTFPVRDPFTYLISVRLREADAFAFEAHYIHDYAEKTGDTKPAELMRRQYPDAYNAYDTKSNDPKETRRESFLSFFKNMSKRYDAETLDALEKILAEQKIIFAEEPMRARRLFSQTSPFRLTAATVRKFGDMGNGENYFDGVTDKELLSSTYLGEINPQTKERLDKITAKYKEFFDKKPAPSGGLRP